MSILCEGGDDLTHLKVLFDLRFDLFIGDSALEGCESLSVGINCSYAEGLEKLLVRDKEVTHTVKASADRTDAAALKALCACGCLNKTGSLFYNVALREMTCGDGISLAAAKEHICHIHNAVDAVIEIDGIGIV